MLVTWTALELDAASHGCPWTPAGATWWQAGAGGPGTAQMPTFDGRWWSVVATWDDADGDLAARPPDLPAASAWHVVLEPASYRGDAVLAGGAQPFAELPPRGKVAGAAAVVTLAGLGPDAARTGEFFDRFVSLGRAVQDAPGHRAALVQAPQDGAVLTFSAWASLRDAVTWAYHRPPSTVDDAHRDTVRRQEEHSLVATSGFLRCAVRSSTGELRGSDPLAGSTGTLVPTPVEDSR